MATYSPVTYQNRRPHAAFVAQENWSSKESSQADLQAGAAAFYPRTSAPAPQQPSYRSTPTYSSSPVFPTAIPPRAQQEQSVPYFQGNRLRIEAGQSSTPETSSNPNHSFGLSLEASSAQPSAGPTPNPKRGSGSSDTPVHLHDSFGRASTSSNSSAAPTMPSSTNLASYGPAAPQPTTLYIPARTAVHVSCGDGQWHYGLWRDNHRTVQLYDRVQGEDGNVHLIFTRTADVALTDQRGHPVYLASNRQRPCFISVSEQTQLFYLHPEAQDRHRGFGEEDFVPIFAGALNPEQ